MSQKVPTKVKLGYGVGAIGKDLCYALVGSFLMFYSTEYLGISSAFMGALFFFARIWDAFNDPMMGTIVDNTKVKWGRYKFWILIGTVANAVVLVLLFNSNIALKIGSPAAYVAVMYILWGMTYTMVDVPYWAYNANVTDDPRERDVVATFARLFAGVGNGAAQVLTVAVVAKLAVDNSRSGIAGGYSKWAMIVALVFVAFILITVFSIKERNIKGQGEKRSFSLKKAGRLLVKNDQLMVIVIVFIILNIGMNMVLGAAVYYFKYVWGDEGIYGQFAIVIAAALVIGMLLYPVLSKKFSRRGILIFSLVMPAIGFLFLLFTVGLMMKSAHALVIFAIPSLVFCTSFGFMNILLTIFMSDCVDYGEWKFGSRSENIVFSMQTFLVKFATAISGLITGFALSFSGYSSGLLGVESGEVAEIVDPAILANVQGALNILMFGVPPVLFVIALIIFVKKWKLHGKFKETVMAELTAKRGEGTVAE